MKSAADDASGVSGLVQAATAVSGTLPTMGEPVPSTFAELKQLDPAGELEAAFKEADWCDELASGGT